MRFVVEPGAFRFWSGTSSADLRGEATVDLAGEVAEYRQREAVARRVAIE